MQYEIIKRSLGKYTARWFFLRRIFYTLIDLLLLRTWHVRRSLNRLSRILPGEAVVLDAGAGFGQYTWRMSRNNRKWKIKASDINEEQVNDCTRFFSQNILSGNVTFVKEDLTRMSDTDLYDLVLTVDVMEHIRDDETVFRAFYRALKKGGYLLISTPSDKGGSDVHREGDKSFIDEHVRNGYPKEEISGKLSDAGFREISIKYTYGIPGHISWLFSMKYPVKMIGTSRFFYIVLPFYYLIFFPFCIILNFMDLYIDHKQGSGLLITALK
jgi:SAM-dependent methyltransferase